ncbi:MYND finger protein [Rhizoctonia solani AG-3 Rhs1AP]|uniref:MYND finger protein n=1 Tax=Rhizoctonia solani AG-3 Rhs1AP TaxID=1086054 RepID=X8IZ27_9AGAM|nr:MYND finger protein [Rhizoctonia solani AG-3 Rhs1AP]
MSHPPFWLTKQFFYPVGNTAAISFTQDLSPEQSAADILLLGCGDPRSILYTLYSDLTIGARKLDITCCDIQPAVLARNILLFSLLDQNENIDRVWNIFYHFKLDDRDFKILTQQSRALYERAEKMDSWEGSRFSSFLKIEDARTLSELRRHWKSYANFSSLPTDRKMRIIKEQIHHSKINAGLSTTLISPGRSAGILWPQAMKPVSELFRKYWETGTTFTLASDIKRATNLNPTFVYSLSGEVFDPFPSTFPSGFHLISAFAPIKSDPTGPTPSAGSVATNTLKQQFAAWCRAFREARKTGLIILRFFAGDAIPFCRALDQFKRTGNPPTNLFVSDYQATQINFTGPVTPTTFDVIDTSNLTDHLGLFNLLLLTHSLLKKTPESQAVLYTETLLPTGQDVTKSFLERLFTDVPTIALLFGIAPRPYVSSFATHSNVHEIIYSEHFNQYHERVAWSDPARGGSLAPSHEPKITSLEVHSLARILYGIHDNMFANEKVDLTTLPNSTNPNVLRDLSTVRFGRETVAIFFRALHDRIHLLDGNWEQVANAFIQKCRSGGNRIIESNCHQDICLQLHLYGIFTTDTLKPNWATDLGLRVSPRNTLFDGWPFLPPVVCVVLTVPHRRLEVFTSQPEMVGSPTLQCSVWVPGSQDNVLAAIQLAWGKCVTPPGSDRVVFEEDPDGQRGQCDLVVSFWASTRILEFPGTRVALCIKPTPRTTFVFMQKLGMHLEVFEASVLDRKFVKILTYRPALAAEPSRTPPIDPLLPPIDFSSDQLCHAIVTGPHSQRVDSLSIRFDVKPKVEQNDLQNGALVSVNQVSPCTIELRIGSHSHLLSYPYPFNGKAHKVRIARKSHYIEVIVPVSMPNEPSGYFLNPSPIMNTGAYTTWNIHHVRLDCLPTLDVRNPAKVDWLNTICALQLSEREQAIRNGDENQKNIAINALVNVKESIHGITVNFSGIQGRRTRTIGLFEKDQDKPHVLLLIGGIKLDPASFTFVLDAAIVPLSSERMAILKSKIHKLQNTGTVVQARTLGHEVEAWKKLIPAFVERCRSWSHRPNCEYTSQGRVPLSTAYDENPICTCGQGIGFTSSEWKAPEWKDLLPFATRAAICPLFSVSYIERVAANWSERREAPSEKPTMVCWACGGPGKPTLSACSGCKKARYCSTACQQRDWKSHKVDCRAN